MAKSANKLLKEQLVLVCIGLLSAFDSKSSALSWCLVQALKVRADSDQNVEHSADVFGWELLVLDQRLDDFHKLAVDFR